MPCYHPQAMGRKGKRAPIQRPCGSCRGCRHETTRVWAVRALHEASLYEQNCFITVTFNDEHVDPKGSLHKKDFQDFMKRLRRRMAPMTYLSYGYDLEDYLKRKPTCSLNLDRPANRPLRQSKIEKIYKPWGVRYLHCGEYGEENGRPHHHALLFNCDFPDKQILKRPRGKALYSSKILEEVWSDPQTSESIGYSSIGQVNFTTAAYVAGYIQKKITGAAAPDHYQGREPEFSLKSTRPGIGSKWYDKFKAELYPRDYTVVKGIKGKIPRFYDKKYQCTNPEDYAILKNNRMLKAKTNPNYSPARLLAAEQIQKSRDEQYRKTL